MTISLNADVPTRYRGEDVRCGTCGAVWPRGVPCPHTDPTLGDARDFLFEAQEDR